MRSWAGPAQSTLIYPPHSLSYPVSATSRACCSVAMHTLISLSSQSNPSLCQLRLSAEIGPFGFSCRGASKCQKVGRSFLSSPAPRRRCSNRPRTQLCCLAYGRMPRASSCGPLPERGPLQALCRTRAYSRQRQSETGSTVRQDSCTGGEGSDYVERAQAIYSDRSGCLRQGRLDGRFRRPLLPPVLP